MEFSKSLNIKYQSDRYSLVNIEYQSGRYSKFTHVTTLIIQSCLNCKRRFTGESMNFIALC